MASATNGLLEQNFPVVEQFGLNTNKAVNFSGWQVDASGNVTVPAGTTYSGSVTGPTGSFNVVNVQQAIITGSTASVAILGTAGASGGGPTTSQMNGWAVVYVAGVKCWVPVWQ